LSGLTEQRTEKILLIVKHNSTINADIAAVIIISFGAFLLQIYS